MNCLVVYNPYSKKNKIEKNIDYIKASLSTKYSTIDFYKTHGVKSITEYLKENSNNYDLIIVSGGDGTVNEAVNGLVEASYKGDFSVIPSGTCNDFSTLLKFSKNIKKQIETILKGVSTPLDICTINNSYFTYGLAIGKYTDVSYKANRKTKRVFGRLAYFIEGLKEFTKYTKLDLDIEIDDKIFSGSYYTVLVLNSNKVAGFKIRNNSVLLDDGLIDVVLIEKNLKGLSWPRLAYFFLFGAKHNKKIKAYKACEIKITSKKALKINADGELAAVSNEALIKVLNKKINIVVSEKVKSKYFNN